MFKGIARLLVATAAGAGLGAGAALARRHVLGTSAATGPASWSPEPIVEPVEATPTAPPVQVADPAAAAAPTPAPSEAPTSALPAPDVADLDAARARLRERAAALRAEMEG